MVGFIKKNKKMFIEGFVLGFFIAFSVAIVAFIYFYFIK